MKIEDKVMMYLNSDEEINEGVFGKFVGRQVLRGFSKEKYFETLINFVNKKIDKELDSGNREASKIVKTAKNIFKKSGYSRLSDKEARKTAIDDLETIGKLIKKASK